MASRITKTMVHKCVGTHKKSVSTVTTASRIRKFYRSISKPCTIKSNRSYAMYAVISRPERWRIWFIFGSTLARNRYLVSIVHLKQPIRVWSRNMNFAIKMYENFDWEVYLDGWSVKILLFRKINGNTSAKTAILRRYSRPHWNHIWKNIIPTATRPFNVNRVRSCQWM